jgi:hypothetical protein
MKQAQKIRFSLLFLSFSLLVNSQNKPNNFALTLDLAGNSGFYTLNGEYEVGKIKDYKLNARIGFGYYSGNNIQFTGIPIGINMLTGTKKHHLELGLGASYIKGIENMQIPAGTFGNPQEWSQQSEGIYFVPSVGYRFDNLTSGLILKVYYSPLITIYDFFDKEKFLNELIPVLYGNWTKEEYYNHAIGSSNAYPKALSQFGNFGISIGYRF